MRTLQAALASSFVVVSGCAERTPHGTTPRSPTNATRRGVSPEDAVHTCHAGQLTTDYEYISNYQCPDGSVPLQGDIRRGQSARVGDVGEGPDGHVLDLYEVPCASPVRVYVDIYHCDLTYSSTGERLLNGGELYAIANAGRMLEQNPTAPQVVGEVRLSAEQARARMMFWLLTSREVEPMLCSELFEGIMPSDRIRRAFAGDASPTEVALAQQFMISFAAFLIEHGQDRIDRNIENLVMANTDAFGGILDVYDILRRADPQTAQPRLTELFEMRASRPEDFRLFVVGASAQCLTSETTEGTQR